MATTTETKYIPATGRRKTATARVRLTPSERTSLTINGKDVQAYFSTEQLRAAALAPLLAVELPTAFEATVVVHGGGISGQATAVSHAIARALTAYRPELRSALKQEGFLKRDPRAKERRKAGLKKARKSPQWSKR